MHYEFQPINGKILNPVSARIPCSTVSQIESQKRMLVVRLNHLLVRDRREKLGGVLLNRRMKDSGGVPRYCIALMLEYEVIWGHIDILVVAVRRLSTSRRWKVKTLLAGPSPTSPTRRRLPTPLFPTFEALLL